MATFILVGAMTVIGVLLMLARLNIKRFLGYPNTVDILFTLLMLWMFAGTFSGMVAAGFASLFMSIILWVLRSTLGAERMAIRKGKLWFIPVPVVYWRTISATECQPHWLARMTKWFFSRERTVA